MELSKSVNFLRPSRITTTEPIQLVFLDAGEKRVNSFGKNRTDFKVLCNEQEFKLSLSQPHVDNLIDVLGTGNTALWVGKIVNAKVRKIKLQSGEVSQSFEFLGLDARVK